MPVIITGPQHDGLTIAFEPVAELLDFPAGTPIDAKIGRLYVALNAALASEAGHDAFGKVRVRLRDLLSATQCMTYTDEFTSPFAALEYCFEECPMDGTPAEVHVWRERWRRLAQRCCALCGRHVELLLERADR